MYFLVQAKVYISRWSRGANCRCLNGPTRRTRGGRDARDLISASATAVIARNICIVQSLAYVASLNPNISPISSMNGQDLCPTRWMNCQLALISRFFSSPRAPTFLHMSNRIHNDMTDLQLDQPFFLDKLIPRRPAGIRRMSHVMLIADLSKTHELHLIVAVGENVGGVMIALGDVRPYGFPKC